MKIKPMLGQFEIPRIERIGTLERRQTVETRVPGLAGSYVTDLGSAPVGIVIEGSLAGDESRDDFLKSVRDAFQAGAPVDFVADITTATEVKQVIVSALRVSEVAGSADSFRYSMTLLQYVEPPAAGAGAGMGFGGLEEVNAGVADEAGSLFDIGQIPDTLSIPNFGDPTPPLTTMLDGVKSAVEKLTAVSGHFTELFGE
ncbi:MAG: hypothetical protein HY822_19320 [Acidobacteria bacterium]|nr:hypothetical protein [Acidobacteriota bacterium]